MWKARKPIFDQRSKEGETKRETKVGSKFEEEGKTNIKRKKETTKINDERERKEEET